MKRYLQQTASAAPLALFRVALGLLLFVSIVRFWAKGWIHELYIAPKYFFPFYGFEFVKPLGEFTYLVFAICAIAALLFALGFLYRAASIVLFVSFTYIELIDKSTYLNHYYFISMVCLLMIFLPANVYFSVDAYRNKNLFFKTIPRWCVDSLKLLICIIYIFAGLAKINSDWLIHAQPLKIWLPAKNDMPVIGALFNFKVTAYIFSWFGCIYDLSIPFLLLNRHTRIVAYSTVVVFHLVTAILFPIGMFPYIMVIAALIFFSDAFHENVINKIKQWLGLSKAFIEEKTLVYSHKISTLFFGVLILFFSVQIALPLRHVLYPGELFWTEQGYRFSWRVMLMEKAGYTQFTVTDDAGKKTTVNNNEFLTPLQEKMMSTQPDMILQYAHMLKAHYLQQGYREPKVFVDSYVSLNGRLGKVLIDPKTDLAMQTESFKHKSWILPFNDEIKGF